MNEQRRTTGSRTPRGFTPALLTLAAGLCLAAPAGPALAQDGLDPSAGRDLKADQDTDARIVQQIIAYRDGLITRNGMSLEEANDMTREVFDRRGTGGALVDQALAQEPGRRQPGAGFAADPGEEDNAQPAPQDGPAEGGETLDGALEGQETVRLSFAEPVALDTLIDYISRALEINIFSDPQLANQTVLIRAPIEVPTDELLLLLSTLLADRGFAIVSGDDNIYRIVPANNTPVEVGGQLATTRIIPTPNLRPSGLQNMLDTVLTGTPSPGQPGGQGGAAVRFTPLDELGLLVVTGETTRLNKVQELIDLLVEARQNQRLHLLPVEHVSASFARERMLRLQGQLQDSTASQFQQGRPGQPNVTRPGVIADAGLSRLGDRLYVHSGNTLLFRGTRDELREVEDLLRVVDEVSPLIAKRYQTGIVTNEVVEAARKLGLGSRTEAAGTQNETFRNFQQRGLTTQTGDEQEIGVSRFQVDPENGTVVYFGTPSQHERFAEMVEQFRADMIDNGTQIRVYKLLYASAGEGRSGTASGRAGSGGGTGGDGGGFGNFGDTQVQATAGPGIAELLRELIRDPESARVEGRFVQGGQTGSGDFSAAEDALLAGQAQGPDALDAARAAAESALGGTRLAATEENTVIVADEARNQVIIKAPALAHQQFERIIAQLDRRQPQVQIDIRIYSLTTNEGFDWSTAYDLEAGQFNLTGLFGVGNTPDGGTIVDPITVSPINPGLTAGLIKSDYVPFALSTLATLGETDVISRPSILVADNVSASVESENEVPFSETTQNANTTTTSQGGVARAGTNVSVTPRISGAGEVTLNLGVALSDFTGQAVGGLQPPAQRDQFRTQITLPTNSTIVIGGFSLTREDETESGLPLIKDIPWIGNLFKDISITSSTRTIFVFITPTIIEQDDDLSLRLRSEGPLAQVGADDGTPSYEPMLIRVRPDDDLLRDTLDRLDPEAEPGFPGPERRDAAADVEQPAPPAIALREGDAR